MNREKDYIIEAMANILIDKYEKETKDYITKLKALPLICSLADKYKLLKKVQECQDAYQIDQGIRYPALYFFILANEINVLQHLEQGLAEYKKRADKSAYNNLERSLFLGDRNQALAFIFQLIIFNKIKNVCSRVDFKVGNGNHDVDLLTNYGDNEAFVEISSIFNFEWYDRHITNSLRGNPSAISFDPSSYKRKIQSTIADKHNQLQVGNNNILILCVSSMGTSETAISNAVKEMYGLNSDAVELFKNREVKDPVDYINSIKQVTVFRYIDRRFSYYASYPSDDLRTYGLDTLKTV